MKEAKRLLSKRNVQFAFIFICILFVLPNFLNSLVINICGVSLLKLHHNIDYEAQYCLDKKSKLNNILINSERGRMLLGYFYYGEGLLEEAKLSFGLDRFSANPLYSYWIGRIYFEEGNLEEAIKYWKGNQAYAQSLLMEADENLQSGEYQKAIEVYEIASQLINDEPKLWVNYGKSLWNVRSKYSTTYSAENIKHLDWKIKEVFSTAVSLDQTDPDSLDWLGWYYFKIERNDLVALRLLKMSFNHGGEISPWVNFHLASVYDKLGNKKSALKHYQLAYDLRPENDVIIASSFSQFLAKTEREIDAIAIVEDILLRVDTNNAAHYLRLVLYYSAICQEERAKEYLFAAEGLNLDSDLNLYNKAKDTLASPPPCK